MHTLSTIQQAYIPLRQAVFPSRLTHSMAAEHKSRLTYDNILRLADDPDVLDPVRYLREREIVHYQRFGDALGVIQDNLDSRNFYAFNPSFD